MATYTAAGTVTLANSDAVDVDLPNSIGTTDYVVSLTPVDHPVPSLWVENKTTGSFVIRTSAPVSVSIDWAVFK